MNETATPPAATQPPAGIRAARDYRVLAERILSPAAWAYLQDGEAETGDANAAAFATRAPMPRPLRELRGGHSRLRLLGQSLAHPILLAPVAYQRLFHADGECASALAAAAQDGQSVISSLASQPLEEIATAGRGADGEGPWFQLYWQGGREATLELLHRALAAGCSAVVFTVDAPVKRASLHLPPGIAAVNQPAMPDPAVGEGQSIVFDGWMARAPTWDDLAWLRRHTRLPLLLKGILHAEDAERAIGLGCDGVIVSSHGGRVLPGAPASLDALPAVVKRVRGRVPVLLDSGIRGGGDVFAALALGASAVMVGRPYVWGLAAAGAIGVAHVIRLLRDELEMTMALCGCPRLDTIAPHCLG
ncbi:MAG: alpha-hydroxy-acid oxidizing protein [Rhodospirillaceae bacterium]|nr:alpha-hydroxy-acid oxidizing protein [Rhodospirillaceae bacterium]